MINKIDLRDLNAFVLIATFGSFTKAAESLNASRSHVSRQLSHLEKQLGITLLIRTTRTLRLTDSGRQLLIQSESALQLIDQAIQEVVDHNEGEKGEIKINCVGGYLGEELIGNIVNQFMKKHPEINILFDFSSRRINLVEEQFDIAFRMGKIQDAGFIARKLLSIKMATLATPNYLARHGEPSHPKDLLKHQCLIGSINRWSFQHKEDKKQTFDVQVEGHLKCKNGRILVNSALANRGIIRVPSLYCQKEINEKKLVAALPDWDIQDIDFSILYHKDKYQPKRMRYFIDFVTNELSK